jgi:hypothetical protein
MSIPFEELVGALNARQQGDGWMACCPAHDDLHPSLSIKADPRRGALLYCFAGCSFGDIVKQLEMWRLWPVEPDEEGADHDPEHESEADLDRKRQASEAAFRIGEAARDARGTRVERYLRARGIILPLPETIRYERSLWHDPTGTWWPAMVASIWTPGWHAIHRTWLHHIHARKAPVEPPKMSLGPVRGGAIQLAPAGATLIVGEGIETVLSVMQKKNLPGWSAVSAGNMCHIDLPEIVRKVILAVDGDATGRRSAALAAHRWKRLGLRVRWLEAPEGKDWNDVILQESKR